MESMGLDVWREELQGTHVGPSRRMGRRSPAFETPRRGSWLSSWRSEWVIEKEAQHLSRRVRPAQVRIGAFGTAAGPSVASAVHDPLFQHRHPAIVCMEGARERASAIRYLAVFHRGPQVACSRPGLGQDMLAVPRCTVVSLSAWNTMVGTVRRASLTIALASRSSSPLSHNGEGRGDVAGGTTGEAEMYPNGCVEIGVGFPHDRGRCRDQSGLPATTLLVSGARPIPALLGIGGRCLGRVGDQEVLLLRKRVHPGAGREIVGRLCASVQHDDERDG